MSSTSERVEFCLEVDGFGAVTMTAPSVDDSIAFKEQYERTTSTYEGGIWRLIECAIASGVDWPAWWPPYQRDRARYIAALDGAPFIEAMPFASGKAKVEEKWRRYELCQSIGVYAPEEVHVPDLYEVLHMVHAEELFQKLEPLHRSTRASYVIKCFPRRRIFADQRDVVDDVWVDARSELLALGLLATGDDIPAEAALWLVPNKELKRIVRMKGIQSSASRVRNELVIREFLAKEDSSVEAAVREGALRNDMYCKMPPPGVSWDQLQAYRWQIRGIVGCLFDLTENHSKMRSWIF
jgi:hypothetical protein